MAVARNSCLLIRPIGLSANPGKIWRSPEKGHAMGSGLLLLYRQLLVTFSQAPLTLYTLLAYAANLRQQAMSRSASSGRKCLCRPVL